MPCPGVSCVHLSQIMKRRRLEPASITTDVGQTRTVVRYEIPVDRDGEIRLADIPIERIDRDQGLHVTGLSGFLFFRDNLHLSENAVFFVNKFQVLVMGPNSTSDSTSTLETDENMVLFLPDSWPVDALLIGWTLVLRYRDNSGEFVLGSPRMREWYSARFTEEQQTEIKRVLRKLCVEKGDESD